MKKFVGFKVLTSRTGDGTFRKGACVFLDWKVCSLVFSKMTTLLEGLVTFVTFKWTLILIQLSKGKYLSCMSVHVFL